MTSETVPATPEPPAVPATRPEAQMLRIYEAAGAPPGPFASLRLAARELTQARHVVWHLFRRDFVAGFRQKLLGYLWIVLAPLLGIASFVFMQMTGILQPGDVGIPYPVFVFMGTSLWGLMIAATQTVAGGLIGNADLVMRTNIPKIALAVTGLANVAYNLAVGLVVLLILTLLVFGLPLTPWALTYPLAVLPLIFLGVGFGLMLAVVGAVARDVTNIFLTAINLVMFVTPVIYSADFADPTLAAIVRWNPLTYLVDTPRALFVLGQVPSWPGYLGASAFALAVLWLGIHAFYLIKDKVAERL